MTQTWIALCTVFAAYMVGERGGGSHQVVLAVACKVVLCTCYLVVWNDCRSRSERSTCVLMIKCTRSTLQGKAQETPRNLRNATDREMILANTSSD